MINFKRNCQECNTSFTVPSDHRSKIFCGRVCSKKHVDRVTAAKNKIKKEERDAIYYTNPKLCKNCSSILTRHDAKNKDFCNSSCAAMVSNALRSKESRKKQGVALKKSNAQKPPRIRNLWVCVCDICGEIALRISKPTKKCTCGKKECYSKFMSHRMRGKTGGTTKQFITYTNSNLSCTLDSSWEVLMAEDLDRNNIVWSRPTSFQLSNKRRYTPDFYLTEYDVYLDPKAYRKGYMKQIEKIKQFEVEFNTRCLVISDKSNLTWEFIKKNLSL